MSELFAYNSAFLTQGITMALMAFFANITFVAYKLRGKELKARPKVEYFKDDTVGSYRWGQQEDFYRVGATAFPELLQYIADKIGDPGINHAIVTRYTDGRVHHIPWHHDKQEGTGGAGAKDIVAGTKIYNIVVCDSPRRFQLAYPDRISTEKHGNASEYVFDDDLVDGSLLTLTAEGNRLLKHRVPKQKGWTGVRYSIVFRTLKLAQATTSKKRKRDVLGLQNDDNKNGVIVS